MHMLGGEQSLATCLLSIALIWANSPSPSSSNRSWILDSSLTLTCLDWGLGVGSLHKYRTEKISFDTYSYEDLGVSINQKLDLGQQFHGATLKKSYFSNSSIQIKVYNGPLYSAPQTTAGAYPWEDNEDGEMSRNYVI